jgi:hypothetical protein
MSVCICASTFKEPGVCLITFSSVRAYVGAPVSLSSYSVVVTLSSCTHVEHVIRFLIVLVTEAAAAALKPTIVCHALCHCSMSDHCAPAEHVTVVSSDQRTTDGRKDGLTTGSGSSL